MAIICEYLNNEASKSLVTALGREIRILVSITLNLSDISDIWNKYKPTNPSTIKKRTKQSVDSCFKRLGYSG